MSNCVYYIICTENPTCNMRMLSIANTHTQVIPFGQLLFLWSPLSVADVFLHIWRTSSLPRSHLHVVLIMPISRSSDDRSSDDLKTRAFAWWKLAPVELYIYDSVKVKFPVVGVGSSEWFATAWQVN